MGGKGVKKLGKKNQIKFTIDCTHPIEDGIMNCGDFEKYLHERIKVAGKTNNFGKRWCWPGRRQSSFSHPTFPSPRDISSISPRSISRRTTSGTGSGSWPTPRTRTS